METGNDKNFSDVRWQAQGPKLLEHTIVKNKNDVKKGATSTRSGPQQAPNWPKSNFKNVFFCIRKKPIISNSSHEASFTLIDNLIMIMSTNCGNLTHSLLYPSSEI